MTFNAKPYLFKPTNLKSWRPEFKHSYVLKKYETEMKENYMSTLRKKNDIECEKIKYLYNKLNSKKYFEEYGLKVPKIYYYTNTARDITGYLREEYVAKPAHMSESDGIFINDSDFKKVNLSLHESLKKSARASEPKMMQQTEKGILVEEYIKYDYEFKVFVLYGCPILADLRDGPKEWHRLDIIDKENPYLNWDKEYEICKEISKDLKIDFFRIDFFYCKEKDQLYAGEFAFRPSTLLGAYIEKYIFERWQQMR